MNNKEEIVLKPCSPKQLALAYGVSKRVLYTWLKQYPRLALYKKKQYNLEQLIFIVENIGPPSRSIESCSESNPVGFITASGFEQ